MYGVPTRLLGNCSSKGHIQGHSTHPIVPSQLIRAPSRWPIPGKVQRSREKISHLLTDPVILPIPASDGQTCRRDPLSNTKQRNIWPAVGGTVLTTTLAGLRARVFRKTKKTEAAGFGRARLGQFNGSPVSWIASLAPFRSPSAIMTGIVTDYYWWKSRRLSLVIPGFSETRLLI